MIGTAEVIVLLAIASLGHAMALVWYIAAQHNWRMCERTIYDFPFKPEQIRRELRNSIHAPIHAMLLGAFLGFGFFKNTSLSSFILSLLATTVWAEVWHYASHRAFHLSALHWIHAEHHKSRLNSPFTAISFAFSEKLIFDLGLLLPLAAIDSVFSMNFFGIAGWYIGYLLINSVSHANFELKSRGYNRGLGRILTSTTYHSLHHSRYTGNYGLGTRFMDKLFKTEWEDYERLYDRISQERRPLTRLQERVGG
jgi:lathosterol oxidase